MNITKIEDNLFKYFYLLNKHKTCEAIFSLFDEFDEFTQDELIKQFGQPGVIDGKYMELKNDILSSFKAIKQLSGTNLDTNVESKLKEVIFTIDKYLDNVFGVYEFDINDVEYLLSKYDLIEIINKEYDEKRKVII